MLKKGLQIISLLLLCTFSFFYTDRVVTVVKNQDPIMIKLNEHQTQHQIKSINAKIIETGIIPGRNGCQVNLEKSYTKMKKVGNYNPNLIEYQEIKPELSLLNTYDKYIIKGNSQEREVAIVIKVNNINNISDINDFLDNKDLKVAYFIDGKDIETNIINIYPLIQGGHEIYNLGYEQEYNKEMLLWTNNMINSIANNRSSYCLALIEQETRLEVCSNQKMHTIKSDIIINYANPFSKVRNQIDKGSILVFDQNSITKQELSGALTYLKQKGYTCLPLSEHLSEKGCQ